MKKNRREEEAEILRQMFSDDENPSEQEAQRTSGKSTSSSADLADVIRCPKCGYVLPSRSSCPRCGYHGYVPMTRKETGKIKLILYPIVLILAVLLYLYMKGYFG